jgi:hypothetical protein
VWHNSYPTSPVTSAMMKPKTRSVLLLVWVLCRFPTTPSRRRRYEFVLRPLAAHGYRRAPFTHAANFSDSSPWHTVSQLLFRCPKPMWGPWACADPLVLLPFNDFVPL